jgi:hypothetical protein
MSSMVTWKWTGPAAAAALALAAGCQKAADIGTGDTDADIDADTDSDTDADSDADTDGDADADTDADTDSIDCDALPQYCCAPGCPCDGTDVTCAPGHDGAQTGLGTCQPPAGQGECWTAADCEIGEFCAGVFVCGCEELCEWEGPGTCASAAAGCCGGDGDCGDGYFCMDLATADTCHGRLGFPSCWTDGDCGSGSCVGASPCPCDAYCIGEPGWCDNWG